MLLLNLSRIRSSYQLLKNTRFGLNLHPKTPSQASTLFTFIAAFASVGKIGVVFKGYKLIKIALTHIFKIG